MKWTTLDDGEQRTFVLVADPGDDPVAALSELAARERLSAAQITGVGAFRRATVGWFDRQAKEYRPIDIDQQCEVLSLLGDVALGPDGRSPAVHAHIVLGLPDGHTRGGHLLGGEVWPTLELIVRDSPARLRKTSRPEIGLALIDLDRSTGAAGTG